MELIAVGGDWWIWDMGFYTGTFNIQTKNCRLWYTTATAINTFLKTFRLHLQLQWNFSFISLVLWFSYLICHLFLFSSLWCQSCGGIFTRHQLIPLYSSQKKEKLLHFSVLLKFNFRFYLSFMFFSSLRFSFFFWSFISQRERMKKEKVVIFHFAIH